MSVKINSMSETTFTATPDGVTKASLNDSVSASTTAFVKTFISTYLIPLASTVTVASTITFSTIYVTLLKGVSSLTLRGNLSIGGTSTTVNLLGNPINVNTSYPGVLSSLTSGNTKIQAGYSTGGPTGQQVNTPIAPVATSVAYVCQYNNNQSTGIDNFNTNGFFNRTNTVMWIMFN